MTELRQREYWWWWLVATAVAMVVVGAAAMDVAAKMRVIVMTIAEAIIPTTAAVWEWW